MNLEELQQGITRIKNKILDEHFVKDVKIEFIQKGDYYWRAENYITKIVIDFTQPLEFNINDQDHARIGNLIFSSHHDADCCEYNYIDFLSLKDTLIDGAKIDQLVITASDEGNFLNFNGCSVNAYSIQNGYYSNSVDLTINEESVMILCGEERDG